VIIRIHSGRYADGGGGAAFIGSGAVNRFVILWPAARRLFGGLSAAA
jgi:hypothetical protein